MVSTQEERVVKEPFVAEFLRKQVRDVKCTTEAIVESAEEYTDARIQ